MIVPQYWAQARRQHRERGRQITVRRFGWSDEGEAQAQAMAEQRATEALQRLVAGEPLPRREPKVPYNGAQGVPIREEIVARHDDVVITRNAYGARCLNTPDVLFADIDSAASASFRFNAAVTIVLSAIAWAIAWSTIEWRLGALLAAVGGFLMALIAGQFLGNALHRLRVRLMGGDAHITRSRIERFLDAHPTWGLRLYRTPNGWRTLATHRLFVPDEPEVDAFFTAIGADPLYVRMCRNQQCFRARVSAKPWRIGIPAHLKPRPGVWPVHAQAMPMRNAWIDRYERAAERFAACAFVAALGVESADPKVQAVAALHDRLCRATAADMPLA